jgi:hypothetical protein
VKERRSAARPPSVQNSAKAAQKRKNEEVAVPVFETKDREVAAQLRAAYRPQIIQSKRAKALRSVPT